MFSEAYDDRDESAKRIARSLFSTSYISEVVASHYSDLFSCKPKVLLLRSGDNDNYLAYESGKPEYVLRITRADKYWLTRTTALEFEAAWLEYLNGQGCLVARPIRMSDGTAVGTLEAPEGRRPFVLFEKLDGSHIHMDLEFARQIGCELAKIHSVSDSFSTSFSPLRIDERRLVDDSLNSILKLSWPSEEDRHFLRELGVELRTFLSALPRNSRSWGIIGGDFHQGNMFCGPDGRPRFFDFDHCGIGWRHFDLATCKWDLKFGASSESAWHPSWERLCNSYLDRYPIDLANEATVDTFVEVRMLWLIGAHARSVDILGDLGGGYWSHFMPVLRNWVEERRKCVRYQ